MPFFSEAEITQLSASQVKCDLLIKMEWKNSTSYLWNGEYPIVVAGNTYLPLHGLATIDGLAHTGGTDSAQVTFSLTGIPENEPNFLKLVLENTPEANQQLVTVYLQLFDDEWQPFGNPIAMWWGFMQPPRISKTTTEGDSGAVQTITISAENVFYNRSRAPRGRYTDRDQQNRFAGDKFFQFVPSLLNASFTYPDY
jgi:hypothetical protein